MEQSTPRHRVGAPFFGDYQSERGLTLTLADVATIGPRLKAKLQQIQQT